MTTGLTTGYSTAGVDEDVSLKLADDLYAQMRLLIRALAKERRDAKGTVISV